MTTIPFQISLRRGLWRLIRTATLLLGFGIVTLALLCALVVLQGQRDDVTRTGPRVDALLVMGTSQNNGVPLPVLRARLDHALDLYRRGVAPRVILTGGATAGDNFTEAGAARDYLLGQGVPEAALLIEDTSRTSYQNLKHSAEIAHANGIASVLIVSDDFHMLRSLKMARDLDLRAYGSPTRTSPIASNLRQQLRYTLREAAAYLVYLFLRR